MGFAHLPRSSLNLGNHSDSHPGTPGSSSGFCRSQSVPRLSLSHNCRTKRCPGIEPCSPPACCPSRSKAKNYAQLGWPGEILVSSSSELQCWLRWEASTPVTTSEILCPTLTKVHRLHLVKMTSNCYTDIVTKYRLDYKTKRSSSNSRFVIGRRSAPPLSRGAGGDSSAANASPCHHNENC